MIFLNRQECPTELINNKVRLTQEFIDSDKKTPVYRQTYIREALLKMTNNKCSYCEMTLVEEGKRMHIEHFHHKNEYPDEVVEWSNLLASCNRCNENKSVHDTYNEPIIDPTKDLPNRLLMFNSGRFYPRKDIGATEVKIAQDTIEVLQLNNSYELVIPRFKKCEVLISKAEDTIVLLDHYLELTRKTIISKNRALTKLNELMILLSDNDEYSAILATEIIKYPRLEELIDKSKSVGIWKDEFNNIFLCMQCISY